MTTDKQKLGVLSRSMQFERSEVNEPERTVALSFSSEQPVSRWFGNEILDHNPKSVRMGRINGSAPLLVNHNHDDVVGVVESATIEGDRKGRAVVRFGSSQRAQEIFDDVKAGIRKLVSVGYRIHKMVTDKIEGDVETLRAMDWEPLEISIVSVPADTSVGVGREAEAVETIFERKLMADNVAAPAAPDIEVVRESVRKDVLTQERNRCNDLRKMADGVAQIITNAKELCERAIESGDSADSFNRTLLANMPKQRHVDAGSSQELGMSKKEVREYSLLRGIQRLAGKQQLDGLEREASDAMAKELGRESRGFFIPTDIMRGAASEDLKRALTTNVFSAAGALVGTNLMSGSLIELLRNNMVVMAMGARSMSGLSGNVAIPRVTGGGTASWLSESGTVTAVDQAVGQVSLTPHRLAAATSYTYQLLAQSSLDVEAFVRNDLMAVLALAKDKAAIVGTGSAGQPLGICNSSNLSTSVTLANAGTMTYAEAVRFQTNVNTNNALDGSLGYLTTKAVKGGTKVTAKFSSTGVPVWEGDSVDGYKALASNQLTGVAATVLFGNWGDLIVADWSGNEVVVDPYSLSTSGQVRIVFHQLTDVAIRHPESFSQSTN
jgi:HK97 family phage major capsid protein/HK97 family phage prohead protease